MALEYPVQLAAPRIEEIARAHPDVIENLRDLSAIATAALFGSLLTLPELQANCFRIEALVHLALAYGEGDRAPTSERMARHRTLGTRQLRPHGRSRRGCVCLASGYRTRKFPCF
jgi:hypothetical protein